MQARRCWRSRGKGAGETVNGVTRQCGGEDVRQVDTLALPAWALRLIYRLAQLERGKAYNVTVLMTGDAPVWTVQSIGKVENGG